MRVRVSNGSANSRDGQRGAGSDRRSQAQHPVGANRDWLLERVATSRSVGWWPSRRNAEGRCSCRGADLQKSVLPAEPFRPAIARRRGQGKKSRGRLEGGKRGVEG